MYFTMPRSLVAATAPAHVGDMLLGYGLDFLPARVLRDCGAVSRVPTPGGRDMVTVEEEVAVHRWWVWDAVRGDKNLGRDPVVVRIERGEMTEDSLTSYLVIFKNGLEQSKKDNVLPARLRLIKDKLTQLFYEFVCMGIFESHKLIFSFQMTTMIMDGEG